MENAEILQFSTTQIAAHIRNQTITPTQAVEAHIQRIQAVNPRINAVITPMFDAARTDAQAKTAYITANGTDDLPPLFGVPITIKDCWAVDGVRFTGGSWYMRDNVADFDAEAVRLFKDAGAIILGKTNLPDMCWLGESINPIFGRTNNPHNVNHSAGGSSGGEGAIIAAGGSPLGLGSDIAGSVRIPAAANGCVSLKPTTGRIPAEDHIPTPPNEILSWNTAGPMARRIEDLDLALRVLSRTPVQDYRQIDLHGRRCTVYIHNGVIPVRKGVVEAVSMAAGTLTKTGMDVVRDDSLPFAGLTLLYTALFRKYGTPAFKKALGGGKPYKLWDEIRANLRGKGHISSEVLFFTESMDMLGIIGRIAGFAHFDKLEAIRQQYLDMMQPGGVILCPLLLTEPPKHGWNWLLAMQPPYTIMFNAMGFPAVVLPIHYNTKKGLPMAVQIVARPNEDEVALAVAAELERVYGGWHMAQVL